MVKSEVVLMVDHPPVYDRLLEVFPHDWPLVTRLRRLPHPLLCSYAPSAISAAFWASVIPVTPVMFMPA